MTAPEASLPNPDGPLRARKPDKAPRKTNAPGWTAKVLLLVVTGGGTLLALKYGSCRDDVVLTFTPPKSVEGYGAGTFEGEAGRTYVVWVNFDSTTGSDVDEHCYINRIEIRQQDQVVATTFCAFPKGGLCMEGRPNGGDCRSTCTFKLEQGGTIDVRSHLETASACNETDEGIVVPSKELARYELKVERVNPD